MGFALDTHQLFHQLFVDVKTASRVDKQRVEPGLLRMLDRAAHERERIVGIRLFKDLLAGCFRNDLQLLSRCRTVNVD
jgi:hypothetical protein